MKKPPFSPQNYRIRYRDGRVETVEARTCMQIGDAHVFYSGVSEEILRVPIDAVLAVEPCPVGSGRARWRRV